MDSVKKVLPSGRPLPAGIAYISLIVGLTAWALFAVIPSIAKNRTVPTPVTSLPSVNLTTGEVELIDRLPELSLRFEENRGQTDARVRFLSRAATNTSFFMDDEVIFTFPQSAESQSGTLDGAVEDAASVGDASDTVSVVRMKLLGANPAPQLRGVEQLPGTIGYFLGPDVGQGLSNIPTFAGIRYFDVYPGIDVVFYGRQGNLEYDFVVAPGADPDDIRLMFEGVDNLSIDDRGHLVANIATGRIHQRAPRVYQEFNGKKERIGSSFTLRDGNQVGFAVEPYDTNRPLIIDPILSYTSYFGAAGRDHGFGVAVDRDGNAYVAGETASVAFPLDASGNPSNVTRGADAYVIKVSPDGSALRYVVYLGGSGHDSIQGLAVDQYGQIVIAGMTSSADFPVENPLQPTFSGGGYDAFVSRLSGDGTSLPFSTYLGGSADDRVRALALDPVGNAYITGETASPDLPYTGPLQPNHAGDYDCFLAGIIGDASPKLELSYLGGSGFDACRAIAISTTRTAFLTGATGSDDFPVINAIQPTYHTGGRDAFVTSVNLNNWLIGYSTYIGGSGDDDARGIAVDHRGAAYLTGKTASTDFPTVNAVQTRFRGGDCDVFVIKIEPLGTALAYATYLGGSEHEIGNGISVDAGGSAVVVGATASADFPLRSPVQTRYGGGPYDLFVTMLGDSGSVLGFSTFLGGSRNDRGLTVALDDANDIYVVGHTLSADFPNTSTSPIQAAPAGNSDTVIAKLSPYQ